MWLDFFTETILCLWYFIISRAVKLVPLSSAGGTAIAARYCTSTEQNHDPLPNDLTYNTTLGHRAVVEDREEIGQCVKKAPAAPSLSQIRNSFHHPGESSWERLEVRGLPWHSDLPVIPLALCCHYGERSNDTIPSFLPACWKHMHCV